MPYSWPRPPTRGRLVTSSQAARPLGVYLLTVEWAGRPWRWSTQPIDIADADQSTTYSYQGGLDRVEVQRSIDALQASPELLSVPFEVDWDDVVALIGQGHDLTAATGEVALAFPGEDWGLRLVLVSGPLSQPQYGYVGDTVAFSVVEAPYLDRALWPPHGARVTTETWSTAPDDSQGVFYPWVFGTPGAYTDTDGSALEVPGSPAVVVAKTGDDADTLLINGGPVEASTVDIWCDGAIESDEAVTTSTDGLGRLVATVDATAFATAANRQASSFYAIWTESGATLDDRTGSAITGAGALARWWLDRSSVRVDDGRWAAAQRFLDRFTVACYVDEQVTPWEWVADNLLPILPVSVVASTDGLAPVVWRWDASTADAVEIIRAEAGTVLDGRVEYSTAPQDLVSEVRVSWALDDDDQTHRRTTTIAPTRHLVVPAMIVIGPGVGPYDPDDYDSHTSLLARTSSARAAGGQIETIESDIIGDEDSAWLVAVNALAVRGFSSRTATYECPQDVAWLEPGDVVHLIDAGISADGVALVTGWRYLETGRVLLTLTMPGMPLRDSRTTGDATGGTFDDPGAS